MYTDTHQVWSPGIAVYLKTQIRWQNMLQGKQSIPSIRLCVHGKYGFCFVDMFLHKIIMFDNRKYYEIQILNFQL